MPVISQNQSPCPLPTITTEDVDSNSTSNPSPDNVFNSPSEEEFSMPPPRVRMRSLSGGAYRLAPTLPNPTRTRRQSGDDILTRASPSRRAALLEHFRPRSKSDSKSKRPTFLTSLKNSFFSGGSQRKNSLDENSLEPLQPGNDYRQRSRSGSESRGGTMSKMIDLFRNRSNSMNVDTTRTRKLSLPSPMPTNALLRRHSVDPEKRRKAANTFRSLDAPQGEPYTCHVDEDTGDNRIDYSSLEDDRIIPTFLSSQTCYNAMPKSGKAIILSTDLLVKNAFSCLVTNEIRAAPLWDSNTHTFVGILTITDFINVLRHYYYSSCEDIKDIENQQIQTWRKITNVTKPFVKAGPNSSLADATKLLIQEGVHRLPIYDEIRNSVLFVITQRRLLNYLYQNLVDKYVGTSLKSLSFLKKSIDELKIGTYEEIATVTPQTKVIEALDLFVERNVSALPVVDDSRLVNIFAKFDVFALAKEQTYHNLDITISEVLEIAGIHEDVCGCALHESLETVIDRFVTYKVHRLVVLDEKHSVVGMISLSDILKFLVLQPLANLDEPAGVTNETIDETPEGGASSDSEYKYASCNSESSITPENCNHLESCNLSREIDKLQICSETDSPPERADSATEIVDETAE